MIGRHDTEEQGTMAGTPTQLVSEYLCRDPALLRDAAQRLTLVDYPADLRDRLAHIVRRSEPCGYAVIHNERLIRTHTRLGALRRVLVQWATQHAPRAIGGYRPLLRWALAQVDWAAVIHCLSLLPQRSVEKVERRARREHREHGGRSPFIGGHAVRERNPAVAG